MLTHVLIEQKSAQEDVLSQCFPQHCMVKAAALTTIGPRLDYQCISPGDSKDCSAYKIHSNTLLYLQDMFSIKRKWQFK